jgi:RNA polymerase sigma-70 factor (ECF subfamily)
LVTVSVETLVTSRSLTRPWLRAISEPAPAPPITDAELVEAVARGDNRMAGALHDRLIGVIDQTVYRVLGRRESDHDDLIQASFEQVVRSLASRSFNGGCSLQTWAARITTHVALNSIRSRRRERRVLVQTEHPAREIAPAGGERRAEARLELRRLQHHLSSMNERYAEILLLHDVHGHDLHEIALMLELTVAAAQSRLVRGRRDLKARIEKDTNLASARRGDS